MKRLLVEELSTKLNEKVLVQGWIHRVRILKNVVFLILRDRTGLVQCVLERSMDCISKLKLESVISIEGINREGKNSLGNFEIIVENVEILNQAVEEPPIEINKEDLNASLDTILNNRVLSLRNIKKNAIFKVQHLIVEGFREYLSKTGFTEVFTPKIVEEGAEGGTEMFKVKYFEREGYLAQSPQFYKQMLVAAGYERVFEIGTFFRAEEHNTSRHLNQFVSMDFEMGFIKDENDVMDMEEETLKYILNKIKIKGSKYFNLLNAKLPEINNPIPRLELKDVMIILKEKYNKETEEGDLDPEGEKLISKYIEENFQSEFVFITNYSRKKRPMYAMPKGDNGTNSFDLIFRGVEITSGGQRIHDYNQLVENFKYKGLNPGDFSSYINTFKYGVPPHGGLAIGLERLTALLLGFQNVRETSIFPRDRTRLIP